jgi:hypothetical protein
MHESYISLQHLAATGEAREPDSHGGDDVPTKPKVSRRRHHAAWALTPALVTAAFALVAVFDVAELHTARNSTYVAIGVLVPLGIMFSLVVAGESLATGALLAPWFTVFAGVPAAMPVVGVLHLIGQDFGVTAVWTSIFSWLGAVILVTLGFLVVDLVGDSGDPYSGGWAP